MNAPWVLAVGGVDSSARAGIAADQEAIEAQGLGMRSVATAWTSQDSAGVHGFSPLEPGVWLRAARQELAAEPLAIKFGLLPGADHVQAAAHLAEQALGKGISVVLDPVLQSSSGYEFLDADALQVLRSDLLCQDLVLTPNLLECAVLAGHPGLVLELDLDQRLASGSQIMELGLRAVLLKGGHGHEDPVCDLVLEKGQKPRWNRHARVPGGSIGGSGCRYASAVAGALARGLDVFAAAQGAGGYVSRLIGKN